MAGRHRFGSTRPVTAMTAELGSTGRRHDASLAVEGWHAGYGGVRVLHGLSLAVGDGGTVALLGTNGNGKSTLIHCIMGVVRPTAGRIVARLDGVEHDLVGLPAQEVVRLGIALVPEGRHLF